MAGEALPEPGRVEGPSWALLTCPAAWGGEAERGGSGCSRHDLGCSSEHFKGGKASWFRALGGQQKK